MWSALCNDNDAGSMFGRWVSVVRGGRGPEEDVCDASWCGREDNNGGRYKMGSDGSVGPGGKVGKSCGFRVEDDDAVRLCAGCVGNVNEGVPTFRLWDVSSLNVEIIAVIFGRGKPVESQDKRRANIYKH